jgi:hypothetical protein
VPRGPQDQPLSIHQQGPFTPTQLFGPIIATYTSHSRRLDRLAIENRGTRLGVASSLHAERLPQGRVNSLPHAYQPPTPKVMVHRLPRRQIVGHQPPGTATTQAIEDCMQDVMHRMAPRPAPCLGRWQLRHQMAPLGVRQIRWIEVSVHSAYSVRMIEAYDHFSDGF